MGFPKPIQVSELDRAVMVVVHDPSSEVLFSSLHPAASFFEKPVSEDLAKQAHINFINALKKAKVDHMTVAEGLKNLDKKEIINELIQTGSIQYVFHGDVSSLSELEMSQLTVNYLHSALANFSVSRMIDLFTLRPIVHLEKDDITPLKVTKIELNPLGNLVFTRDQQIITKKGLIMGKMNTYQRSLEISVMKLFFKSQGHQPIYEIKGAGRLEGGDYIPVSKDLAMLGIGLLSNWDAVYQLLDNDCFGVPSVAVVEDLYDLSTDRMHLDTVFNIVDDKRVVILEDILKDEKKKRWVTIFKEMSEKEEEEEEAIRREGGEGGRRKRERRGKYVKQEGERIEFGKYLSEILGFELITATNEQQLAYLINFVNLGETVLGNPTIIAVNKELEEMIKLKGFKGHVELIDYDGLTRMYGAAHCTSQVIRAST